MRFVSVMMPKDPNVLPRLVCEDGKTVECSMLLPPIDGDLYMSRDLALVHYARVILANQCNCLQRHLDGQTILLILKTALVSAKDMRRFYEYCNIQDKTMTQKPLPRRGIRTARKRLTIFLDVIATEFDQRQAFLATQIQCGKQLSTILLEVPRPAFVNTSNFFFFCLLFRPALRAIASCSSSMRWIWCCLTPQKPRRR